MTNLDSLTTFFSENSFGVIIGMLGVFFLLASIMKSIRNRRERQLRADTEAAAANGGTPDAPVHIGNPFEVAPPPAPPAPPAPPTPEGSAAQGGASAPAPASGEAGSASGTPAPSAPAASPDEDKYVWE